MREKVVGGGGLRTTTLRAGRRIFHSLSRPCAILVGEKSSRVPVSSRKTRAKSVRKALVGGLVHGILSAARALYFVGAGLTRWGRKSERRGSPR